MARDLQHLCDDRFALDVLTKGREPATLLVMNVVASGTFSVLYALASLPVRPRRYAALLSAHAAYVFVVPRMFELLPAAPRGRLVVDAVGIMLTVATGYSMFLRFINITIASGDVGGDLVDLVDDDGRWLAYVADVSGHGVGPGVVMGMFKSTVRMRARGGGSIGALFEDVHAVLMPLKQPATFVTVACVRGGCSPSSRLSPSKTSTIPSVRSARRRRTRRWAMGVLAAEWRQPLSSIADRLLSEARRHGPQLDDQSLLLIRRLAPGELTTPMA